MFAPYYGFMFTLEVAFIFNLKHFYEINQSFFSSAILELFLPPQVSKTTVSCLYREQPSRHLHVQS